MVSRRIARAVVVALSAVDDLPVRKFAQLRRMTSMRSCNRLEDFATASKSNDVPRFFARTLILFSHLMCTASSLSLKLPAFPRSTCPNGTASSAAWGPYGRSRIRKSRLHGIRPKPYCATGVPTADEAETLAHAFSGTRSGPLRVVLGDGDLP